MRSEETWQCCKCLWPVLRVELQHFVMSNDPGAANATRCDAEFGTFGSGVDRNNGSILVSAEKSTTRNPDLTSPVDGEARRTIRADSLLTIELLRETRFDSQHGAVLQDDPLSPIRRQECSYYRGAVKGFWQGL